MLHTYIEQFLRYCQASNFPPKSIEALQARVRQFDRYCQAITVDSIAEVGYEYLLAFVADFDTPSVHVKKNRVWALHQFYHFLKLNHLIEENIAAYIPYPKIWYRAVLHWPGSYRRLLEKPVSLSQKPVRSVACNCD